MNLVHGIDLINLPRLERALTLHGEKMLGKLLTPRERDYCQSSPPKLRLQRVGGRIALKEAVSKALGVGINGLGWNQGIDWQDVEILRQAKAPPTLQLFGKAQAIADTLQITQWRISISHDGPAVMASVIGFNAG